MSEARLLMVVRVVLGLLLIRQGAIGLSDLQHQVNVLELHQGWRAFPLVGTLRPIELALGISSLEFAIGIFLAGGLLTRFMALGTAIISGFSLLAFSTLGTIANLAHALLLLASLTIVVRGGGVGTMDKMLGSMQRRSIEREAEREALRSAERDEAQRQRDEAREPTAPG